MRSRGTQPAIASVTISGPFDVKASGDSPSRKRIFVCTPSTRFARSGQAPSSDASDLDCARKILSTLARRAYRHLITDADLQDLLPFYESGRKEGGFDRGFQRAIERLLVSSQFLFRIERPPANLAGVANLAGTVYRVSDLKLASRLSFFIRSSIPDDELLAVAIAGR